MVVGVRVNSALSPSIKQSGRQPPPPPPPSSPPDLHCCVVWLLPALAAMD